MAKLATTPVENEVLTAWTKLSDDQRLQLLPLLINRTGEWQNWALSETTLVAWLRWKFEEAKQPFPNLR